MKYLRSIITIGIISPAATIVGCGVGVNNLDIRKVDAEQALLNQEFDQTYYCVDNDGNVELLLHQSGGEEGNIEQMVYLRTFWRVVPGKTGADPSGTNAYVTYFIISGNRGAIYRGAGMVLLKGKPGRHRLGANIKSANLDLVNHSAHFPDIFGAAVMSGKISARHDKAALRKIYRRFERRTRPLES